MKSAKILFTEQYKLYYITYLLKTEHCILKGKNIHVFSDAYKMTMKSDFSNITRSFLYKCAHVIPMKSNKTKHIMQSCQMMSLHCYLAFAMTEKHFCSCNKMTENQTDFERCSVYQVFLDHNPCLGYFDPSANVSKPTVLEHNEELLHEESYLMEWIQVIIGNRFQTNF